MFVAVALQLCCSVCGSSAALPVVEALGAVRGSACVAVCCSVFNVLQCVAVCAILLSFVDALGAVGGTVCVRVCVAACFNVLQCVAVCCRICWGCQKLCVCV